MKNFTDSLLHRSLVVLGYVVQGATLVNEVGLETLKIGVPLPSWAKIAIPAAGLLAQKLAELLPTNELKATTGTNDDSGAAIGKASGEAALRASNQVFRKSP